MIDEDTGRRTLFRYMNREGAQKTLETSTLRYAPASSLHGQREFCFTPREPLDHDYVHKICDPEYRSLLMEIAETNPIANSLLDALAAGDYDLVGAEIYNYLPVFHEAAGRMLKNAQEILFNELDERFLILCLTERKNNAHMWAHFAEDYRGCVFEFKWATGKYTKRVRYAEQAPAWHPMMRYDDGEHYMDIMLHKFPEFQQEEEWRHLEIRELLSGKDGNCPEPKEHGFARLHPQVLTGIYFGKSSDSADDEWLNTMKALLNQDRYQHIRKYRMTETSDETHIEFEPMSD